MFTKIRNFLAQYEKSALVFAAVFIAFFLVGLSTLGRVGNTGKSYTLRSNAAIVYELSLTSSQSKLAGVYLNVNGVYVEEGEHAHITVRRSSTAASDSWVSSSLGTVEIGNIADGDFAGANGNWCDLFGTLSLSSSYRYYKVSADESVNIAEIVFLGDDGNYIPATVSAEYSQNIDAEEASYTLDAQKRFSYGTTAYSCFTESEGYVLLTVNNFLLGSSYVEGESYTVSSAYSVFACCLTALGTFVFGVSPFALRLMPFLATLLSLLFFYKLMKLLCKKGVYATCYSLLFMVSGVTFTLGRLGTPMALAVCFVVMSVYFMYRFFHAGISSARVAKSAGNILLSGAFFALALQMSLYAAFPLLLSVALFVAGMARQRAAAAYHREKLARTYEEKLAAATGEEKEVLRQEGITETKRLALSCRRKDDYAVSYFVGSFVLLPVILFLLAALFSYNALIRAGGNFSSPGTALSLFASRYFSSLFAVDVTSYTAANAVTPFAWFFSLRGATLLSSSTETTFCGVVANLNIALAVLSFVSALFVADTLVKWRAARTERRYKMLLRGALLFFSGALLSLLPYLFLSDAGAEQSLLFSLFYIGFIPLALFAMREFYGDTKGKRTVCLVLFAACALVFLLQTPVLFSYPVPAAMQVLFSWTSLL